METKVRSIDVIAKLSARQRLLLVSDNRIIIIIIIVLLIPLFTFTEVVVLTGCSSGLGRKTAQALLRSGEYHVIGAVRDLDKMDVVAELDGLDSKSFTPIYCEMNSFQSVREFCEKVNEFRLSKPIDRLICNAGIYQPSLPYPKWSVDNHEQTMQVNFLSHFLMISILMKSMMDSTDPRVVMVGSVTGNDNTVRMTITKSGATTTKQTNQDSKYCLYCNFLGWWRWSLPDRRSTRLGWIRKRIPESHCHGRRLRIHRSKSLQRFQTLPHDDGQLSTYSLPQVDRNFIQQYVPWLHRRISTLQRKAYVVPQVLSHLYEIHCRYVNLMDGILNIYI